MSYPIVFIKRNRLASVRRRHPWIFSGGVHSFNGCKDGDIVTVRSADNEFLGIGYFQNGSIMVRLLTFDEEVIDTTFWSRKIDVALSLRKTLSIPSPRTNAYRLINGEGDGIPGLIVDVYNEIAVIQCHTIGIFKKRYEISSAIESSLSGTITTVFVKSGNTLTGLKSNEDGDHFIKGTNGKTTILENGHSFIVNVVTGQKTGFFLDQRLNRQLLTSYSRNKSVLNLFCYTGGFSVYALNGSAKNVTSVDASEKAIQLCNENVQLTGRLTGHTGIVADVHYYLNSVDPEEFDLIIIDPPAYAKSTRKKHNAVQAYKRINAAAMRKIKPGGIIFTFSCSQVVDRALFTNTIIAAAIEAGRSCQLLHHLSQGPDHPVNIFHPEGHYLKGLVLKVD